MGEKVERCVKEKRSRGVGGYWERRELVILLYVRERD